MNVYVPEEGKVKVLLARPCVVEVVSSVLCVCLEFIAEQNFSLFLTSVNLITCSKEKSSKCTWTVQAHLVQVWCRK